MEEPAVLSTAAPQATSVLDVTEDYFVLENCVVIENLLLDFKSRTLPA